MRVGAVVSSATGALPRAQVGGIGRPDALGLPAPISAPDGVGNSRRSRNRAPRASRHRSSRRRRLARRRARASNAPRAGACRVLRARARARRAASSTAPAGSGRPPLARSRASAPRSPSRLEQHPALRAAARDGPRLAALAGAGHRARITRARSAIRAARAATLAPEVLYLDPMSRRGASRRSAIDGCARRRAARGRRATRRGAAPSAWTSGGLSAVTSSASCSKTPPRRRPFEALPPRATTRSPAAARASTSGTRRVVRPRSTCGRERLGGEAAPRSTPSQKAGSRTRRASDRARRAARRGVQASRFVQAFSTPRSPRRR